MSKDIIRISIVVEIYQGCEKMSKLSM